MSKETHDKHGAGAGSEHAEAVSPEIDDDAALGTIDSTFKTFALPSLFRDESSFEAWESSDESNLRICFAREQFSAKVADEWTQGTVVTLASADHEPVELYHNERLIARGILVTKRGRIGIKVTQLVDVRRVRKTA